MTPLSVTKNFNGDVEERAKEIKKLHEQVQNKIRKQNEKIASKQISIENQQLSRKVTWFGFILGRKGFPPKDLLS